MRIAYEVAPMTAETSHRFALTGHDPKAVTAQSSCGRRLIW
jgi:hypothetical protein